MPKLIMHIVARFDEPGAEVFGAGTTLDATDCDSVQDGIREVVSALAAKLDIPRRETQAERELRLFQEARDAQR